MTGRRAAALTLAVLAGGTACAPGTSTTEQTRTAPSPSTPREPSVSDSQQGRAALQQERDRVRALVDAVKPLAPKARWVATSDGEAPCGTPGDSGWPKVWDYGIRVLSGGEPGLANRVVARFEADGWVFSRTAAASGVTRLQARRDGVLLVIASGQDGAWADVSANSPCVQQDGTLRT